MTQEQAERLQRAIVVPASTRGRPVPGSPQHDRGQLQDSIVSDLSSACPVRSCKSRW